MIDKRQVMYDIERCISNVPDACKDCSRFVNGGAFDAFKCMEGLLKDSLELLKEQEPVKPVKEQIFSFIFGWVCGACGFPLLSDGYMYCPRCGRKVKWDE